MKTFTARSMEHALALVKQAYGSNGVILHTRSYKQGGLMGFGGKNVVEVTAADGRELGRKYRKDAQRSPRAQALAGRPPRLSSVMPQTRQPAPIAQGYAQSAPAPSPTAGDLIRKTYAAARADLDTSSQPVATVPTPTATVEAPPRVERLTPPPENLKVAEDLAAVKQMVAKLMRQQKAASALARPDGSSPDPCTPDLPDPLVDQYLKLLEQEVAEELAEEVVKKVHNSLAPEEIEDKQKLERAMLAEIARRLPTDPDAGKLQPKTDARPRTIALIGPTGVGKTTTLAKLAATFKLKQGKKVGLITMDTYRIAAVDQLRTYAGIIGLPLQVVNNAEDLAEALHSYRDLDAVLIDTAGRSQRAQDKLCELKEILKTADPHETHLVLSSTVSQRVLLETIELFAAVDHDRMIFTKLDEAVTGGVLLNVARRVGKRVSYVTTGQEVPHQIEPGSSDRLAELVMGRRRTEA
ncbi:MAG: flagellar biosynthesis protein FlhF [Planctomycetota bacterium]